MNNRLALGLAVGAGYLLGRTKKAKLAFAVASAVAGKRLHLSPRAVTELATQQLEKNPQLKELGTKLGDDLRGAGKAATGALVTRQANDLADRLHERTSRVRDVVEGALPEPPGGTSGRDDEEDAEAYGDEDAEEEPEGRDEKRSSAQKSAERASSERRSSKRTSSEKRAKKAPAKKSDPKKSATKKAPARKTPARRPAATKRTATSVQPREGRDRG